MEENNAFLAWYKQDLQDWAELYGVSLRYHPDYPLRPARALRASLRAAELGPAPAFALAVFRAYWSESRDISDLETLGEIATACGLDAAVIRAAAMDKAYGGRLEANTRAAIDRGILRRAQHHLPRQALLRQRPSRPARPLARRRGPAGIRAFVSLIRVSYGFSTSKGGRMARGTPTPCSISRFFSTSSPRIAGRAAGLAPRVRERTWFSTAWINRASDDRRFRRRAAFARPPRYRNGVPHRGTGPPPYYHAGSRK